MEDVISCEVISNDSFMIEDEESDGWNGDENDMWNEEALLEYGSPLPQSITIKDLTDIIYGYHCWIYYQGKHYDAECPNGVSNLFDLPFFQRVLTNQEDI